VVRFLAYRKAPLQLSSISFNLFRVTGSEVLTMSDFEGEKFGNIMLQCLLLFAQDTNFIEHAPGLKPLSAVLSNRHGP